MGFVNTIGYEENMKAWSGEWLSLRGFIAQREEVLAEVAAMKKVSVSMLKKVIPQKFIGMTDVMGMSISGDKIIIDRESGSVSGEIEFVEKREFQILEKNGRYDIVDKNNNVMFSYFSYQSKYHAEDMFYMYSYAIRSEDGKAIYLSVTDIDRQTEGTDGSSIHAFISEDIEGLDDKKNMCTFVLCDGTENTVLKGLFGL